ncbi:hypothetical protein BVRB_4g095410 [Beta vulgaris subsp. vulgaris]|uniref:Ferritin n=1 Tax=Beta vulgaris subsp. vulgaris TaxID=3555 RepID=A0A0J8BDW6_BETVV|nr:hypothetical protein BVRB_4g095410 [Beta vulgaris subsp. vulgaris]
MASTRPGHLVGRRSLLARGASLPRSWSASGASWPVHLLGQPWTRPAKPERAARPLDQSTRSDLASQARESCSATTNSTARPVGPYPCSASRAPARPATRVPARPASKAPARPATRVPARPASRAPARPATRVHARPASRAPARPASKSIPSARDPRDWLILAPRTLTSVIFEPFEEVKKELSMVPTVPQVSLARQKYADECEAAINEQINVGYNVSYVYHAMFAYFDRDNVALKGLSKFFKESM